MPIVDTAAGEGATSTVGSIVYVRHNAYRNGTDLPAGEIRVVSPSDGHDRRLAIGRDVSFSADASVMAFARFHRVVVSRVSGGRLLSVPVTKRARVALAPDGRRLLWWDRELHLVDVATGEDRVLSGGRVEQAAWSPDGSRVVFDHETIWDPIWVPVEL